MNLSTASQPHLLSLTLLLVFSGVVAAEDYRHLFPHMQAQQQQRALLAEQSIEGLKQQLKLLKRARIDRKQKLLLEQQLQAQLEMVQSQLKELQTTPLPFTPTLNVSALHPRRYVSAGILVDAQGKPAKVRVIDYLAPPPNSQHKGILYVRCEGQLLSIGGLSNEEVASFKPEDIVTLQQVFHCNAITLGGQEFQGKVFSSLTFNGVDLIPNKQPIYHLHPLNLEDLREQLAEHARQQ